MFNLNEVSKNFRADFEEFRHLKMAIYGMGNHARGVLQDVTGFNIIGVVIKESTTGIFCGKPLMRLDEAFRENIQMIVIAAATHIELLIYERIAADCQAHGVRIFGLHCGDMDALLKKHHIFGYMGSDLPTPDFVRAQIDAHDIISFDIFDTLLMRKVRFPQDIFILVEKRAVNAGLANDGFCVKRAYAELKNPHKNANLDEIYAFFRELEGCSEKTANELKRLELETEAQVLTVREPVVQCLRYARQKGKRIYLVSDMYLPKQILRTMLAKLGIEDYDDLLVSNEYRTSKREALFSVYRKLCGEDSCLHIGDHLEFDGIQALKSGIDSIILFNTYILMERYKYNDEFSIACSINERSMVGLFASHLFENPFVDKLYVQDAYTYGYLFLAPILTRFLIWLIEKAEQERVTMLLFAARDGFLLQKMFRLGTSILKKGQSIRDIYFYTSRRACIRAYCGDEEALSEVLTGYSFTMDDINRIFSLQDDGDCERTKEKVFQQSLVERRGYARYIESLRISHGEKVGFVDLFSAGTSQSILEKLFFQSLTGFYLYQPIGDVIRMPPVVHSLVKEMPFEPIKYFSSLDQVVTLESVVTSEQPTLLGFEENGNLIFDEKNVSETRNAFIAQAQQGILAFYQDFLKNLYVENEDIHMSLCKKFLNLRMSIDIDESFLSCMSMEDEFRNEHWVYGRNCAFITKSSENRKD